MTSTVVIIGSPRGGNSKSLALAMAEGAKENGNEIKTFELNKLKNVKGCQSCYGCKKKGFCIVNDDHTPILQAIRDADSVIFSTPLYFSQSCGQFRLLEDRFFGFLNGDFTPNIAPGKKFAVIVTCGSGFDDAQNVAGNIELEWERFFKGVSVGKIVMKDGGAVDAASKNAKIMAEAKAIGKKL